MTGTRAGLESQQRGRHPRNRDGPKSPRPSVGPSETSFHGHRHGPSLHRPTCAADSQDSGRPGSRMADRGGAAARSVPVRGPWGRGACAGGAACGWGRPDSPDELSAGGAWRPELDPCGPTVCEPAPLAGFTGSSAGFRPGLPNLPEGREGAGQQGSGGLGRERPVPCSWSSRVPLGRPRNWGRRRAGEAQTNGEGGGDSGERPHPERGCSSTGWLRGEGVCQKWLQEAAGVSVCAHVCGRARAGEQGPWPPGSAPPSFRRSPSPPTHRPTATGSCEPGLPSGDPCHHPECPSPGLCLNTPLPQRLLGLPKIGL